MSTNLMLEMDRPFVLRLMAKRSWTRDQMAWLELVALRAREGEGVARIGTAALLGLRRMFAAARDARMAGGGRWRTALGVLTRSDRGYRLDGVVCVALTGRVVSEMGAPVIERVGADALADAQQWCGIGCVSCGNSDEIEGICLRCLCGFNL